MTDGNDNNNVNNLVDFKVSDSGDELFENSNSGYQDIETKSHNNKIVGPEELFFGVTPQSRRQCQSIFNLIFIVGVVIILILTINDASLWKRGTYGSISTSRYNLTISRNVKNVTIVDPIINNDKEEIVGQLSIINDFRYSPIAIIRGTNKPISGYRNDSDGHMSFWTSNQGNLTKAIHIDNFQRIGINTDDPQEVLDINGKAISNVGFMTVSDKNLKYDIKPLSSSYSINIVRNVQPKIFKRISNKIKQNQTHLGFIAQDFEQFKNNFVTMNNNAYKYIDTTAIMAHLWNTIKILDKRISNLENKNKN